MDEHYIFNYLLFTLIVKTPWRVYSGHTLCSVFSWLPCFNLNRERQESYIVSVTFP
jgi:hypothetical protein